MYNTQKDTTVSTELYLAETPTGDREPYDWDRATIFVGMVIYPDDGAPEGRRVTVTAWTHRDAPVAVTCRKGELGAFPKPMADALKALRADFPSRETASRERDRLAAEKKATTTKPVAKPTATPKPAPKPASKARPPERVATPAAVEATGAGPLFAGVAQEEALP